VTAPQIFWTFTARFRVPVKFAILPAFGERFRNELNPAIAEMEMAVSGLGGRGKFSTPVHILARGSIPRFSSDDQPIRISVGLRDSFQPAIAAGKHDEFW
jgi:hypothetical protein